ncbi:MAG: ATP-binding protein [Saprospiraceae bacterium]
MEISNYKKATLQIPNDLRYLSVAIHFVLQNALLRGFAEKQLDAIELAVEEAVSNVIRHAFKAEEQAEFSVICEQIPLGLKIIVKDQGMPFDPTVLPEYDPKLLKKDAPIQGLGWYLMQRSMDEVIFHNLGPEGKEIHLIKYLYEKTEEDLPEEERTKPRRFLKPTRFAEEDEDLKCAPEAQALVIPEKQGPVTLKPTPFKVRKAKPSDAIGIAKCAYDAYGYSYKEYVYYPERLNQMIADGGIISVVAVTKDEKEEVIAHAALVFEDPGEKIAEMGMAFTKKSHQGQGCGKKMGVLLVKEVLKHRLRGWYAYTTTAHIISQKTANKTGARDCCILLGDAPASRKIKIFPQHPSGEPGFTVF